MQLEVLAAIKARQQLIDFDSNLTPCLSALPCRAGRGGRGRGSGRGGGGGRGQGGDGFFNPSMLENPWAALERQKLHISPQIGVAAADSNDGESGRLDPNGVADRPWH
jgi:hypothetical protein